MSRSIAKILCFLNLVVALFMSPAVFSRADSAHVGKIYAINVPGVGVGNELDLDEAMELVKQYRWIYANASLKDLKKAKDEAVKLSNEINRPLVMVFMSRQILDNTRNEYPQRFQDSMKSLIGASLEDGREILVTARSYGVHQALRAVRHFDSPSLLLIGIAPAFGAFGNAWSENVAQYVSDVSNTQSRYCMIASEKDVFTWRQGGAAYKKRVGYHGDNDVGKAMDENEHNVHIQLLNDASHAPIDEYIRYGLMSAMQECAAGFGLEDTPVGDVVFSRRPDAGTHNGETTSVSHTGRPAIPPSSDNWDVRPATPPPPATRSVRPATPPPPATRSVRPATPPPPAMRSVRPATPPPLPEDTSGITESPGSIGSQPSHQ